MYLVGILKTLEFEVCLFLVSLIIIFLLWFFMFFVALVGFIEESGREGEKRPLFCYV